MTDNNLEKNENQNEIVEPKDDIVNTDDIVFDDDTDMPAPETQSYEQVLKYTPKFVDLFMEAIGDMPYSSILENSEGNTIKISDLARFIKVKQPNGLSIKEMNTIINFISGAPFKYVHNLMGMIENKQLQTELWTIE